ncbi:hypothetical protein LZL87_006134 [Fusarium oxysporum]|nr:hypothetical protein LZL87_006134 [Fusarium oxysporum]
MTLSRRFLILGTLCLLYNTAAAQSPDSILTDAPKCAVDCLTELLSQKEYVEMGQEAMCSSKPFAKAMGVCLMTKCSMIQTMDFIKASSAACGIPPINNTTVYRLSCTIAFALAIVFFALRIGTKFRLGLTWGMDDALTTLSVAVMIPYYVVLQINLPRQQVQDNGQVHHGLQHSHRVGFFIFVFFQIQPFSLFWDGWQQKKGLLILTGFTNFALPHAGLNLLLDVWMLILPMTQLWGMGLKLRKKLGVMSMFSVGIFLTIVAAIRVRELVAFLTSQDLTVQHAQTAFIWSNVEISVGVMVACMPHVRHLIFVDRSLVTIEVGDSQAIELNDEGGLLTANTYIKNGIAMNRDADIEMTVMID